jgi:hypothetical protein
VRENLGDFWKACIYFNVSFPRYGMSLPLAFTNQMCCSMNLKNMQSTSLE